MAEYKRGQRVRVTLENLQITGEGCPSNSQSVEVTNPDGRMWFVPASAAHVRIEVLDPAEWPPQVGDIWEACGPEWFARVNSLDRLFLIAEDYRPNHYTDDFKTLNPVLVRRRGQ